jgi:hypothetical protein
MVEEESSRQSKQGKDLRLRLERVGEAFHSTRKRKEGNRSGVRTGLLWTLDTRALVVRQSFIYEYAFCIKTCYRSNRLPLKVKSPTTLSTTCEMFYSIRYYICILNGWRGCALSGFHVPRFARSKQWSNKSNKSKHVWPARATKANQNLQISQKMPETG